jgi:hypothetical protein
MLNPVGNFEQPLSGIPFKAAYHLAMRTSIQALLIFTSFLVAAAQESHERESPRGGRALLPTKVPGSSHEVLAGEIDVWENRRYGSTNMSDSRSFSLTRTLSKAVPSAGAGD